MGLGEGGKEKRAAALFLDSPGGKILDLSDILSLGGIQKNES